MQLRSALLGLLALGGLAGSARGQDEAARSGAPASAAGRGAPGTSRFSTQLGYYHHDDDGGNPFLDEELTVIEPVFVWESNVNEDFGYSVTFSYDHVSSASIERLSNYPEQSGASGDNYFSLDYASRHRVAEGAWLGWMLGGSLEYDYTSIHFGGSYATESPDENTTTNVALTGFYDTLDIIRFDGTQSEGTDTRLSLAATYSLYQVLTPKWASELSATLSVQSGFLETPYNAVVLEDPSFPANPALDNLANGVEFTEELPDTRVRSALQYRARRSLASGRAVEFGGRLYADDWGIVSVALEPKWYEELVPSRLRMQLRYRYYNQTEADDFAEHFRGALPSDLPAHRTQDAELGAFDSHGIGARFDLTPGERHGWYLDLEYDVRSDDLDGWFAAVGYSVTF